MYGQNLQVFSEINGLQTVKLLIAGDKLPIECRRMKKFMVKKILTLPFGNCIYAFEYK